MGGKRPYKSPDTSRRPARVRYVQEPNVSASIQSIDVGNGTYTPGERVETEVRVENNGSDSHTFYVGYTVYGPDGDHYDNGGTTGQEVNLVARENRDVVVEWDVDSAAEEGSYDVQVAVWKQSDPSNLVDRLDEVWTYDAFYVRRTEVEASIIDITPQRGEYLPGDLVTSSVIVENTGGTDHSYFVEFSAVGPGGNEYDNGATTGKAVTVVSGDRRTIDLEWNVPSNAPEGGYNLHVQMYSQRDSTNLETVIDERTVEEAFVIADSGVSVVDITTTPADGKVASFDTTAVATAALENTGGSSKTIFVEHGIIDPDKSLVVSNIDEVELQPGESHRVSIRWELSREQDLIQGRYDYEVTLRSTSDEELMTRTLDDAFRVMTAAGGRTDYTVDLREATGGAVEQATVGLTPVEGGKHFSQRLRDGSVRFDRIPNGLYELTVDHGDALLEESFDVWVSSTFSSAYLTVSAAEVITGSVVDDSGHQPVPDATVRLEGIDETTTGPLGAYSFDRRVPDGTYDMTVEGPNGSTIRESVTVGDSRHVGLELDRPLVDPALREQTPNSDLITEENQVVTVFARYLQNTDTEDVVINGYTDLIHGIVKGIVAAIMDILGTLKETVITILGLDLGELLQGLARFIGALWDTRGGILLEIAGAILTSAVGGLEALHERQRQDNPYNIPNPRAYVFTEGWYLGYIALNLLLGWVVKFVSLGLRSALTASDTLTDALDTATTAVRQLNDEGRTITTPNDFSQLNKARSATTARTPDGLPGREDLIGMFSIRRMIDDAPHPDLLNKLITATYSTNHQQLGRIGIRNSAFESSWNDPLDDFRGRSWNELSGGEKGQLRGGLAEQILVERFLSGRGSFPKVSRVMSEFDAQSIPVGEKGILTNWKVESDNFNFDAEFDFVEFEMRQLEDGRDPVPVVTRIWESTTESETSTDLTRVRKERKLEQVIDDSRSENRVTPESRGLSGNAFDRMDSSPEVRPITWKDELDTSSARIDQTAEYMLDNHKPLDFLFKPPNNND